MEIFNITEEDFLDPTKVKIIDGIAGAGKSSLIDAFFKSKEIHYMRCTSTNVLRRDAEERYNIPCETVAGGLFTTENCHFFMAEKYPEIKTIVIDEILQTSIKTLDWIDSHKGDYNIIVTTDSCQMLAQDSGVAFLNKFLEYTKNDYCIYRELTETKRARDAQTKGIYSYLYNKVKEETKAFDEVKNCFEFIEMDSIDYNPNDVYICHTKEIEEELYQRWGLDSRYDLPLIPKGNIARKQPKDISRYPIYSQIKSERHKSVGAYLQIKNIATPTRYQGSEVTDEQTLYYIIEKDSVISNRELYTVLTRCYHMASMKIVYIDLNRKPKIKEFNNLPVTKYLFYEVKTEEEFNYIKKELKKNFLFFQKMMMEKQREIGLKNGAYNRHCLKYDGTIYTVNELVEEEQQKYIPPKFTARSLIEKEAYFDYTFMDEVYQILDEHGANRIYYCHYKNNTKKDDYSYDLDLFSAYPAVLKFGKLPIDGNIYREESPERLNFYLYKGNDLTPNCIVTDTIANILPRKDTEFLFSTDYRIGSKMGDYLWAKAHKTQEDKKSLKCVHYGYWQKPFLEPYVDERDSLILNDETGKMEKGIRKTGYYVRVEGHNHELLMVAICCEMLAIILKLITAEYGYVQIDALHFNNKEKMNDLIKIMQTYFPNYDFRIEDKTNHTILYKSYEDLQSKEDIKREQARLRKQRQRAREKEEKKRRKEQ